MTYVANSLEMLENIAISHGCELVTATPTTVLVDLDSPTLYRRDAVERLAEEKFGLRFVDAWQSRSGNWHLRYTVAQPLPPYALIALQLALGSDPTREIIALWEYDQTDSDTRSLFKPKTTEKK